jgi:predicted ArsR family transcriptional regulator
VEEVEVDPVGEQLSRVGVLAEPVRRALYRYVAGQREAVSREQAANAVGLPLHTAKFHLDRLVKGGLLDVEFRRLTGRSGPGAGRPSKLYRRSPGQLSVSLPERRYDLAAEVLAEAVEQSLRSGAPVGEVLPDIAASTGRRVGAGLSDRTSAAVDGPDDPDVDSGPVGEDQARLVATGRVLADCGYEPVLEPEGEPVAVCLANCPFDRLATDHTDLVCGLNRDFVAGVIEGAGIEGLTAHLAPRPGYCCVKVSS